MSKTTTKSAIMDIINSRKARCLPIAHGQLKPRIYPIGSNRTSGPDGYRQCYLKVQYSCIVEMSSKYDYILIGENGMRICIILFFLNIDTNSIMGSTYVRTKY